MRFNPPLARRPRRAAAASAMSHAGQFRSMKRRMKIMAQSGAGGMSEISRVRYAASTNGSDSSAIAGYRCGLEFRAEQLRGAILRPVFPVVAPRSSINHRNDERDDCDAKNRGERVEHHCSPIRYSAAAKSTNHPMIPVAINRNDGDCCITRSVNTKAATIRLASVRRLSLNAVRCRSVNRSIVRTNQYASSMPLSKERDREFHTPRYCNCCQLQPRHSAQVFHGAHCSWRVVPPTLQCVRDRQQPPRRANADSSW